MRIHTYIGIKKRQKKQCNGKNASRKQHSTLTSRQINVISLVLVYVSSCMNKSIMYKKGKNNHHIKISAVVSELLQKNLYECHILIKSSFIIFATIQHK